MQYLDKLDLQALDETPKLTEWLKNTDNAKIAYDDVAVLQEFERSSDRSWFDAGSKAFENFGSTSMLGLGKAWDGIALAFLNEAKHGKGFGDIDPDFMIDKLSPEQLTQRREWQAAAEARRDKLIDERMKSIEKAETEIGRLTPKGMTEMEEGIRGGMQVGIDVLPGMLVSALTRGRINPTLGLMGGKVFGESYASATAAGKEHDVAVAYAAIDSIIEIATERFPVKRLEGVVGNLGGTSGKVWAKRFLLEEIGGEQVASIGQTINAYAHDLDEELAAAVGWEEVMDIQSRRQAVTLIATVIGGGSIAGTVKSIDYLASREQRAMGKLMSDMNRRRGSEFEQARLDDLISLSQSSKTNERASDMFEDLVAKMNPDQEIFMDAEAVDLLDNPPEYLTKQMDGSGGTVSMPLSVFLKDFANDEKLMEIVRPFIKTSEKYQNQAETEQEDDSEFIKKVLAQAAETQETKSTADAIYERVTEQLIATGRLSAASARQSAALIPAQVTVQYEYLKSIDYKNEDGSAVTLEQVFADIGLEIVGPQVDVAADFMTQEDLGDPNAPIFAEMTTNFVRDQGFGESLTDRGTVKVFHGTSRQNADAIRAGGNLTGFPFLALDRATAARFAQQAGGTVEIMELEVDASSIIPTGGYLTARNEGLVADQDGVYRGAKSPVVSPRVLKQQNFSTIELTEDRVDAAGNALTITENAGVLWQEQQVRKDNVNKLRNCLRA